MPRKAFITGISGQDGYYLAKYLKSLGYTVHGLLRRASTTPPRIKELLGEYPSITLHYGDLSDPLSLCRILTDVQPDEIYNLAAQSHVAVSFEGPEYTADIDALGPLRILEIMRNEPTLKHTRFYQASSSEMFGASPSPQSIDTPFKPQSIYALSKVFAHETVRIYREAYGLYACCGILFNHESPHRHESFVTQKIVDGLIAYQKHRVPFSLGNIESKRDWGHAEDYVRAIHLMLQQEFPQDHVICTGESYSVAEFAWHVAQELGIDLYWKGSPIQGFDAETDACIIQRNPKLYRPIDVQDLRGVCSNFLPWSPQKSLKDLVRDMVRAKLHCV